MFLDVAGVQSLRRFSVPFNELFRFSVLPLYGIVESYVLGGYLPPIEYALTWITQQDRAVVVLYGASGDWNIITSGVRFSSTKGTA